MEKHVPQPVLCKSRHVLYAIQALCFWQIYLSWAGKQFSEAIREKRYERKARSLVVEAPPPILASASKPQKNLLFVPAIPSPVSGQRVAQLLSKRLPGLAFIRYCTPTLNIQVGLNWPHYVDRRMRAEYFCTLENCWGTFFLEVYMFQISVLLWAWVSKEKTNNLAEGTKTEINSLLTL